MATRTGRAPAFRLFRTRGPWSADAGWPWRERPLGVNLEPLVLVAPNPAVTECCMIGFVLIQVGEEICLWGWQINVCFFYISTDLFFNKTTPPIVDSRTLLFWAKQTFFNYFMFSVSQCRWTQKEIWDSPTTCVNKIYRKFQYEIPVKETITWLVNSVIIK